MDQQLIVAGFHRSGTSFTTQLLRASGLFIGDDLLGADASNPYGHFEDVVPFRIHESILADNGLDWRIDTVRPFRVSAANWERIHQYVQQRRSSHHEWGFKDPRVCLFLGVWKHVLPDARILVVFRDYRDSVRSLRRRHANNLFRDRGSLDVNQSFFDDVDLPLRMWIAHNRALLAAVRAYPHDVMVVPLEAVQEGYPLVKELRRRFGFHLEDVDAAEIYDASVTKRTHEPLPVSSPALGRRAEVTLQALWNASTL